MKKMTKEQVIAIENECINLNHVGKQDVAWMLTNGLLYMREHGWLTETAQQYFEDNCFHPDPSDPDGFI